VILSPYNFNLELILNISELYSLVNLKLCNRKCIQCFWENKFPLIVISFFQVFPKNKGIFDCEILNLQFLVKMMTLENHDICLILTRFFIVSFNDVFETHDMLMNFDIKDP
jgi:hypothetical protein